MTGTDRRRDVRQGSGAEPASPPAAGRIAGSSANSLAAMAATGATTTGVDVDADNPTGAVRLCASIGSAPTDKTIVYLKDAGS